MKKLPWMNTFNISEDQLQTWTLKKPKNMAVTFWCLKSQLLKSNDYLSWAQKHYSLPKLKQNYKSFEIDPEFWQQIKNVMNWPESCVPLYLWQSTLFVLVTEPLELTWSFPVSYILGSPEQIEYYKNALQAQPAEVAPKPTAPEAMPELPQPPSLAAQESLELENNLALASEDQDEFTGTNIMTMADLEQLTIESKQLPNLEESQNSLLEKKHAKGPSKVDAQTLTKKLKALSSNEDPLDFDKLTDENHETDESKQGNSLEIPEGFNLFGDESLIKNDDKPADLPPANLLESPEGLEGLLPDSLSSASTNDSLPEALNLTEASTESVLIKEKGPSNSEKITVSEPDLIKPNTKDASSSIKKREVKQTSAQNNKDLLTNLNGHFSQCLILELKNKKLILTDHQHNWSLKNKNIELALDKEPNLFNFCLLSKKPFHGQVSSLDSMKENLFKALELSSKEAFLTLAPVISDNHQVDFFIIGLGQKEDEKALLKIEKSLPQIKEALAI